MFIYCKPYQLVNVKHNWKQYYINITTRSPGESTVPIIITGWVGDIINVTSEIGDLV